MVKISQAPKPVLLFDISLVVGKRTFFNGCLIIDRDKALVNATRG